MFLLYLRRKHPVDKKETYITRRIYGAGAGGGGGGVGIGQDEAEEKEEEKKFSVNQASAYTEESTHRGVN